MVSKLESVLQSEQKMVNGQKLRILLMSELELATKVSDPEVLNNVGNLIKNDEKKIDAIIINGGLAYVPDRYSRWRGERLDLMEDRLLERYGKEVYDEVNKRRNESDSVDDIVEAARLAKVQMRNIYLQAKKKNIPIYYVYGDTDYKNVKMIIEVLEKLNKTNLKYENQKRKQNNVPDDEVEKILSVIPDGYAFKASKWKSADKQGIKDKAIEIYNHTIETIFKDKPGSASTNVKIYKRFENYVGNDNNDKTEDITINGFKLKVFHAINGLTVGFNEGMPSDRNLNLIIDYVNTDQRLGDIYITGRGSTTEFTAIDKQGRKDPVWIMNQGPLLDMDKQLRLRSSFNKTSVSKRMNKQEDSSVSFFSINEDGSAEIEHVDYTALKKGTDIAKLEKNISKGSMYEIFGISDWHVGSPDAMYEHMEVIPKIIKRSETPFQQKKLTSNGDMIDGGNDKLQRTKMSLTRYDAPEKLIEKLEDILKADSQYQSNAKNNLKEEFYRIIGDLLYKGSDSDIFRQESRLDTYLKPIAPLVSGVYSVGGNHAEKATGNGSEGYLVSSKFQSWNTPNVVNVDPMLMRNEIPYLDNYGLYLVHSAGYRGGFDARSALLKELSSMGYDLVDIAIAGDCHEAGIKFAANRRDDEWGTRAAITLPALQRHTQFELHILHKPAFTKGISSLYVPVDPEIGTSYMKYKMIPAQSMQSEIDSSGGSRYYKAIDGIIKKLGHD